MYMSIEKDLKSYMQTVLITSEWLTLGVRK